MTDARLYLWDLSVAGGIFGFGLISMRLLRLKRAPLAVVGTFGISLWIAVGGILNLLHLLRPGVFFALVGLGLLLLIVDLFLSRRTRPAPDPSPQPRFTLPAKLLLIAAVALIGCMFVGGMRPLRWCFDDREGYIALAVKAGQMHSIQPDPFCERRVQAGVGGGNFLDTLMYATGDIRAMTFIDSSFGLALYALGLWAIGSRWKIPPARIAFALLCLPLATLMKLNLTIIYLSAAGFFATLLLLTDAPEAERFSAGRITALGVILGALCTTKTPNLVFVMPLLFGAILLYRLFQSRTQPLLPIVIALLIATATFIPWSIANKTNAGTYLYPLLGPGIHISAYHLIYTPSQTGSLAQMVLLTLPNFALLLLSLAVTWKLTTHWPTAHRAAAVAYIGASLVALPITVYGLGGGDVDRYTAPLVMPSYLLTLLIVLAQTARRRPLWRLLGAATLSLAGIYTMYFIGARVGWYLELKTTLYEAFGRVPRHQPSIEEHLDRSEIQQHLAYGARIQQSMPPGATALVNMKASYIFDFRRNTIYIGDHLGMATPPPGLPLNQSPEAQRQFLIHQGVHYIVLDRTPPDYCQNNTDLHLDASNWPNFLRDERQHFPFRTFLDDPLFTHTYAPWVIVEFSVSCHEREVMSRIADSRPQVFNDGNIVVARID
jgi:hypothetical protein